MGAGPWIKYANPSTDDAAPWDKYAQPTAQQALEPPPVDSEYYAKNIGIGALKSAGQTASAVGNLANKAIGSDYLSDKINQLKNATQYSNVAQEGGGILEQMGELGLANAILPGSGLLKIPVSAGLGAASARVHGGNPYVGAVAGAVGEGIGQGLNFAGDLAESGSFGLKANPKTIGTAPPGSAFNPAMKVTPRDALEYAAAHNIPISPAQGTGNALARQLGALGERSLIRGQAVEEGKQAAAQAFAANSERLMNAHDPYALGSSDTTTGDTLQKSVSIARDVAHDNASYKYDNLPTSLLSSQVDIRSIASNARAMLKDMDVALRNRNPQVAAQIRGALEHVASMGTPAQAANGAPYIEPSLSFKDAIRVRSDLLKDAGLLRQAGAPTEIEGLYGRIENQLDSAMSGAAAKDGSAKEWNSANQAWRNYKQTFYGKQSPLGRILQTNDPQAVTQYVLGRRSVADIAALKSINADAALEALRGQVVRRIAGAGYRVGVGAGNRGLGGFSDDFLKELFGPQGTQELYKNASVAHMMKLNVNPSGTSNVLLSQEQIGLSPRRFLPAAVGAKYAMPTNAASMLPGNAPLWQRLAAAGVRIAGKLPGPGLVALSNLAGQ